MPANVLILADANGAGSTALQNALISAGNTVTLRSAPEYTWDGTNPSLNGYNVVIHLDGATYANPLPVTAQQDLENFVNAGGGFIGAQWDGYEKTIGQQVNMPDLVLQGWGGSNDDNGGGINITYTAVSGQQNNPILAGLPSSFTFFADGHDAAPLTTYSTQPSTVVMTAPHGGPAVIERDFGTGRVVNFSFAADYVIQNTLQDANIQKLYVNAVAWASQSASQTITFNALPNHTYGDADFALTATASSGLPVSYTATGNATVYQDSNSNWFAHLTGAGTATITASQAGNSSYSAASNVSQPFTISPATLTVTANNVSRLYGAGDPTFTASYSGFVNGDTTSILSGSPSLTSTDTSTSPAGSYTITAAQGTLSAGNNYTFAFVNGTLTILPPAAGVNVTGTEGAAFTNQAVATFTDPAGSAALSSYSATIDWGDGTTATTGTITVSGTAFTVSGGHTYAEEGTYPITVSISYAGLSPATATSTATVADVPPTLTVSGPTNVNEGSTYTLNLSATSIDPILSWTINWGDGSSIQTVAGNPSSVNHVYLDGTHYYTILASATTEDGTFAAAPVGGNAQASLDPAFGTGGEVTQNFNGSTADYARSVMVTQPDGKVLVAGYTQGGKNNIGLARYNPDGSLDTTFGNGGRVVTDFGVSEAVTSMVLDSSGRILVGGDFGLARYNPDGSLDTSFGVNGWLNTFQYIQRVLFDANGDILVGGNGRLGRFLPNGTVDLSFGQNGTAYTQGWFYDFTLDGSGRIVTTGYQYVSLGGNLYRYDLFVQRYTSTGALDTTFAQNGRFTLNAGGDWAFGYKVVIQGGQILVGGVDEVEQYNASYGYYQESTSSILLLRLTDAGTLDSTFGSAGTVRFRYNSSSNNYDYLSAMGVDPSGRILVRGNYGVYRFAPDGSPDTSFGMSGTGYTWTPIYAYGVSDDAFAFDSAQRIYLCGYYYSGTQGANFAVERFSDTGTPDTSFDSNPNDGVTLVQTDFVGPLADYIQQVAVESDGKIVVAGYTQGGSTELILARYLADGELDPTFGSGGINRTGLFIYPTAEAVAADGTIYLANYGYIYRFKADGSRDTTTTGFGPGDQLWANGIGVHNLAFDSQGRLLVGGYIYQPGPGGTQYSEDFAVARYSATGVLDTSFGTNGIASFDLHTTATVQGNQYVYGMAVDANDGVILVGQTYDYTQPNTYTNQGGLIVHFNAAGQLDTSFGTNGYILAGQYTWDSAKSVARDAQGRILVGFSSGLLQRYLSNGTLDTSFGNNGSVSNSYYGVTALDVDSTGQILAAGYNTVARWNADGTPDKAFAPGGRLTIPARYINAITVDASGDVLTAGYTDGTGRPTGVDFWLARYRTGGLAVTVNDVAPQNLTITGPTSANEGDTITLTASATDPGILDVLTYTWNITRNGSTYLQASGSSVNIDFLDNGTYVATVTVSDGELSVSKSQTISVANVAPTATFSNNGPTTYGGTVTASFTSAYDSSSADTSAGFHYTYSIDDSGNGLASTYAGSSTAASTTYSGLTVGTHTVYGRIFDKDNGYTQYQTTITVNKATLTVTANDQSRLYGAADSTFTYSVTGFVNGDTSSVLSGSPSLTSNDSVTSPVGSYTITAGLGSLSAANYTFTFVNGTLTITQDATTTTVSPSVSSPVFGQPVSFTATVTANAPGSGTPDGTAQFYIDGSPFGSPVTLVGGSATSASTTTLSVGPHTVTAVYSGSGNFTGSQGAVTGSTSVINTIAGNGTSGFSGDGGAATAAELFNPVGVAVDSHGNIFIVDSSNNRIREVSSSGEITTVAGNGTYGYSGDGGPATSAELASPLGLAVDAAGDLFIADNNNSVIREVNTAGIITTVAGNGTNGRSGDGGPATAAQLWGPYGVAVDAHGDLFIADGYNYAVREVSPTGIITTVAGNGNDGYSGDGGPATAAALSRPTGLAVDGAGNLYIADFDNNVVRKVNSAGIITTIAGSGTSGYSGDGGPATAAQLHGPFSVAVDAAGNLFIVDRVNDAIREVNTSGVISTVAGNGTFGYSGDGGPATTAQLAIPGGVALDAAGDIIIGDQFNSVVREVGAASYTVSPAATTTAVATSGSPSTWGQSVVFTATVSVTTPGAGTPTGTVTFKDGGTTIGSGTLQLVGGQDEATFSTTSLAVGSHTITAVYNTDGNFDSSTSTGITQQVNQATPTITWANPAGITYGTALSATQLDATASVPGTFTYSPAAGTVLGAGDDQTLSVTFTPTDTTDYTGATANVSINVDKATLTVTANNASRLYGAGDPAFTASYSGFVNGDTASVLSGSPSLTSTDTPTSPAGTYTITASQGTLSAANYSFAFVNGTLTILPAPVGVNVSGAEGTAFTNQAVATFTDPAGAGALSQYAATIDWGDGTAATTGTITVSGTTFTVSGGHSYAEEGTYTVNVSISYVGLSPATATSTATIADVAPSNVSLSATPATINEDASTTVNGSFTDPGLLDTHTVSIDWGDGSAKTTLSLAAGVFTFNADHQYLDNLPGNAPYTVTATVTDTDGGSTGSTVTPLASPFTGDFSDGFETAPQGFSKSLSVFGGEGTVSGIDPTQDGTVVTGSFSFFSLTVPHSGSRLMGSLQAVNWQFNDPVEKFGGWFANNTNIGGASIEFYDAANNLIATESVNAPTGSAWTWNGWDVPGGFTRAQIVSNFSHGQFIEFDDMQLTLAAPQPSASGNTQVVVNNVPPTATLSGSGPVTYGNAVTVSFTNPSDPSPVDTGAGFHYAISLDPNAVASATYASSSASPSQAFNLPAGTYIVYGRIIDKDDGFTAYQTTVTVNPATPTVPTPTVPSNAVYNGQPQGATVGHVTGVNNVDLGAPTLTYYAGTYTLSSLPSSGGSSDAPSEAGDYTVVASYAGSNNYTSASSLATYSIGQATTAFSNLTVQQIVLGTTTTSVSGRLTSNTIVPVGQNVSITLNGLTQSATVGANGSFSVSFATGGLGAGAYPISYSYAGDNNFTVTSGTGRLTVAYGTQLLFNNSKPVHSGAALPIKLALTDASGANISSPNIAVSATGLVDANGNAVPLNAEGNANPNNLFRYDAGLGGYIFNLSTKGLKAGTYTFYYKAGNDPTLHSLTFVVD